MRRSSSSITPALSASPTSILISSSVTVALSSDLDPNRLKIRLVEALSSQTAGAATFESTSIRGAMAQAMALRVAQGELLGHQLADDDGEIGDEADHDAVAQGLGGALGHALGQEDVGQPAAERGAREGAGQDADEGDADLDRGQEPARILHENQGRAGARSGPARPWP